MQMMQARCAECEWVFDIVAIPMEGMKAATGAMKRGSCCPMCGNDKRQKILMANPRPLTEQEANHKRKLLPANFLTNEGTAA